MNNNDIYIGSIISSHIWQHLLEEEKVTFRFDMVDIGIYKRENHSLYIARSQSHNIEYMGELNTKTLISFYNEEPTNNEPIHTSLLKSYDFHIIAESELYYATKNPQIERLTTDIFFFRKECPCVVTYDGELSPYHIQDFLESKIDI